VESHYVLSDLSGLFSHNHRGRRFHESEIRTTVGGMFNYLIASWESHELFLSRTGTKGWTEEQPSEKFLVSMLLEST